MNSRSEWAEWGHVLKVTSYIFTNFSDEFENKCAKLLGNNNSHKIILIVKKVLDITDFSIDYYLSKLDDCSIHCIIKQQRKSKE